MPYNYMAMHFTKIKNTERLYRNFRLKTKKINIFKNNNNKRVKILGHLKLNRLTRFISEKIKLCYNLILSR